MGRFRLLGVLPLSFGALACLWLGPAVPQAWAAAAEPPQDSTSPNVGQPLRPSSPEQQALGAFLRARGFVFYGAWWCPACFKQKDLFGQQAGNQLPYVECDKQPEQRERCQAAGIQAYPTWVRGNERREGVLSLDELKRWSGFQGDSRTKVGLPPAGVAASGGVNP
jgi:hypothetical protein